MAVTGLSGAYGNIYESRYASSKKEVTEKQEAEQAAGKKCFFRKEKGIQSNCAV